MPGILPMKVIKVGSNAQARIAQACDRCRSKKIRCDGIRPSCTQCVNVGFECKTSDKLSRRAFPRGYTESLEERVRGLEAEVRELKDLLDEKDEKIDMLSRIHSHSPQPASTQRRTSVATNSSSDCQEEAAQEKDIVFKVLQSPLLLDDENSDAYFIGTSSGRMLIDAFKHKIQETGRPCPHITPEAFFPTELRTSPSVQSSRDRNVTWKAPPRLVSDQLVNIFFQEWAPLFPVLHRPTFLALYEEYVAKPESMSDRKSLVQLNLVFSIAALSSDSRHSHDIEAFELQWQTALESIVMDNTLSTLQCLVLAQLCCLQKADYARLLKYNGLAVSLSHRLGLHQSQKRFALGALTSETRKKVFWTLYTLDCFCAAQLGLPKLIKEEDVQCEYPVDADDEYVTEKGFLPSLPGEFTKLSSALALFRASRILARVLTENYPPTASHELSFRNLIALSDELDEWSKNLAPHLRLQFAQDKPSTGIISSRSPLLSLAYHYVRSLIYRPAVCASSDLGDRASTALVALAASSKHIVQVVQLLEERKLSFTFCVNKDELMVLSGFGLLFQGMTLDPESKLMKDVQKSVRSVIEILGRWCSPGAADFKRLSCSMLSISQPEVRRPATLSRHNSDSSMTAPQDAFTATQRQLKAIVSRFSIPSSKHTRHESKEVRRATLPNISSTGSVGHHLNPSQASISSIRSEPALSPLSLRSSPPGPAPLPNPRKRTSVPARQVTNLDYLPLGPEPASTTPPSATYPYTTNTTGKTDVSQTDWERLLSSLDNGQTNIYDTIYGGLPIEALSDVPPLSGRGGGDAQLVWSPEMWSLTADTLGAPPPQSVLSFSDESLTSGSEVFAADEFAAQGADSYGGILIPGDLSPAAPGELVGLVGLDGGFGL